MVGYIASAVRLSPTTLNMFQGRLSYIFRKFSLSSCVRQGSHITVTHIDVECQPETLVIRDDKSLLRPLHYSNQCTDFEILSCWLVPTRCPQIIPPASRRPVRVTVRLHHYLWTSPVQRRVYAKARPFSRDLETRLCHTQMAICHMTTRVPRGSV